MFDFELTHEDGAEVLQLTGEVEGEQDTELLAEALQHAQPEVALILDLTEVSAIDVDAALLLRDLLTRRSIAARTVVVSPSRFVAMQLVLHDVDRASPIVPTARDAAAILRSVGPDRRAGADFG